MAVIYFSQIPPELLDKYRKNELEVFIYDHHPNSENDFQTHSDKSVVTECGSATSVITHQLAQKVSVTRNIAKSNACGE